ncbi:MAG: four helix bundle protein [Planctomycetota bacterium]
MARKDNKNCNIIREDTVEYKVAQRVRSYMDLIVWQKADDLFVDLIADVDIFPRTQAARVISEQLIRSIGSISANIAEGFGRRNRNDFAYHLGISRGEANESHNWYHKCGRIKYLSQEIVDKRKASLEEIAKMLTSLISKVTKNRK